MKTRKQQIGIIGCGGIALSKHLPALAKLTDLCELTAFCDIDEPKAASAAKQFGVPRCQGVHRLQETAGRRKS